MSAISRLREAQAQLTAKNVSQETITLIGLELTKAADSLDGKHRETLAEIRSRILVTQNLLILRAIRAREIGELIQELEAANAC